MIPFLTYPLALLALGSLPVLAAIYILRNRFRRRQVSSLLLWRFHIQSREGGSRIHRLQLPLLFFLELLALALLAVAAAGPHWKLPRAGRPLIVVLDDSFSMRAGAGHRSARERARDYLETLYRFQPPPSTRLLLAGSEPQLLGAPVKTGSQVNRLLDRWTCWAPASALDSAVALASQLGRQRANLLVLTDHPPDDTNALNGRLEWRAFGAPLGNLAFVNASRAANGKTDRCLLEVDNFSAQPAQTDLRVATGSNLVQQTRLAFAPHEQKRLVFNLSAAAPRLDATLSDDALAADNRVQLLPPIRRRVRVLVALTNSTLRDLAGRALDATGLRAAISDDPELVIQDTAASPGSNAWSLRWIVPAKPSAYTGPFLLDSSQPLSDGLALQGVVWAAAPMTNSDSPDAVPIILAGNVPLLSASEDLLGRRFLTLNLDPRLSTVQTTPDWPILFWNLLQWRASHLPGLAASNARLGTALMLQTAGEPVAVTGPDGAVQRFGAATEQLALNEPRPGLYSVAMGGSTNQFAVNPLAADESDLSACATGQWGAWRSDREVEFAQSPLAWLFALAAVGLLVAHLWLVASRKESGAAGISAGPTWRLGGPRGLPAGRHGGAAPPDSEVQQSKTRAKFSG